MQRSAYGKANNSKRVYGKAEETGNDVDNEQTNRNKAESITPNQWIKQGDRRAGIIKIMEDWEEKDQGGRHET